MIGHDVSWSSAPKFGRRDGKPLSWLMVLTSRLYHGARPASPSWTGKVLEGSGRGLILRFYPGIRLEGLRNTAKKLRISGLRAKIWTRDLQNTEQECWPLDAKRRTCPHAPDAVVTCTTHYTTETQTVGRIWIPNTRKAQFNAIRARQ
jgi:hypothetical protein